MSHNYGDKLYKAIKELLTEHLLQEVRQTLIESSSIQFLTTFQSVWNDYRQAVHLIRLIVTYMDRVYVPKQGLLPTYTLGLRLFRDHILRDTNIRRND